MKMETKYDNMLWADLKTNTQKCKFIRCGRAFETGIIAKELEKEVADLFMRKTVGDLDSEERARAFNIVGLMRLDRITEHSSLYELLDAIYNKHSDTKQLIREIKETIENAN